MRKILTVLVILSLAGVAQAAYIEDFEGFSAPVSPGWTTVAATWATGSRTVTAGSGTGADQGLVTAGNAGAYTAHGEDVTTAGQVVTMDAYMKASSYGYMHLYGDESNRMTIRIAPGNQYQIEVQDNGSYVLAVNVDPLSDAINSSEFYHGRITWTIGTGVVLQAWDESNVLQANQSVSWTETPTVALDNVGFWAFSAIAMDDISVTSIPEPATMGGLILGAAGLIIRRRRRR